MSENRLLPAATSHDVYWRNPAIDPPPRGTKLWLLTSGGVSIVGSWVDDSNLIAWSPNPKRPIGLVQLPGGYYGWAMPARDDGA